MLTPLFPGPAFSLYRPYLNRGLKLVFHDIDQTKIITEKMRTITKWEMGNDKH